MSTILTASEAKQARLSLGISQGSVATALNINRSYLSLFEGEKYLLNDNTRNALRELYEEKGYSFTGEEITEAEDGPFWSEEDMEMGKPNLRVIDGIEIPRATSDNQAEMLLSERIENSNKIREICAKKVKPGVFGFLFDDIDQGDLDQQMDKVVMLLARNEIIVQQLQGHLDYMESDTDSKRSEITVGNALAAKFLDYAPKASAVS